MYVCVLCMYVCEDVCVVDVQEVKEVEVKREVEVKAVQEDAFDEVIEV
jgi:hypothetical protein